MATDRVQPGPNVLLEIAECARPAERRLKAKSAVDPGLALCARLENLVPALLLFCATLPARAVRALERTAEVVVAARAEVGREALDQRLIDSEKLQQAIVAGRVCGKQRAQGLLAGGAGLGAFALRLERRELGLTAARRRERRRRDERGIAAGIRRGTGRGARADAILAGLTLGRAVIAECGELPASVRGAPVAAASRCGTAAAAIIRSAVHPVVTEALRRARLRGARAVDTALPADAAFGVRAARTAVALCIAAPSRTRDGAARRNEGTVAAGLIAHASGVAAVLASDAARAAYCIASPSAAHTRFAAPAAVCRSARGRRALTL